VTEPDSLARRVALDFVERSRALLDPFLQSPTRFNEKMAVVVGHHRADNDAYRVDVMLDELLMELLAQHKVGGRVFSEESGWRTLGTGHGYTMVCDPFDNTFLSTRAVRESSVVLSIAGQDGRLACCVIGDLSTRAVFLADSRGSFLLEPDDAGEWQEQPLSTSSVIRLEDAFVVLPAFLKPRRREALDVADLVARARYLLTMDGAIFFGRLAAGYIDAYVDVVVGQPVYELAALEIMTRAGGVVTDGSGTPLDLSDVISGIEQNPDGRTTIVAASTAALHAELMRTLGS
jgi:fructose-1,6-bisphosphatase/inositol monophosphatase family enzyme